MLPALNNKFIFNNKIVIVGILHISNVIRILLPGNNNPVSESSYFIILLYDEN